MLAGGFNRNPMPRRKGGEMVDSSESVVGRRIAVLIDADITQSSLIEQILQEVGKYGLVTIRRIYGDFTEANMKGWKDILQLHAIQPIQQYRNTIGKNATDSALIIDAMDTLYGGMVNGFCIVSSDSDYTRLATRIREAAVFVMGIGKKMTPRSFVNACEVFVFTENLVPDTRPAPPARPSRRAKPAAAQEPQEPREPSSREVSDLLARAFGMAVQDDGWALLGTLGTRLHQIDPGFDPRTYGYRQLSHLVRSHEDFEIKEEKSREGPSHIYLRRKE